jgi:hypothetical protein
VAKKKRPFMAKKERSNSAFGRRYPGSSKNRKYRISRAKKGIDLYPSFTTEGRYPSAEKRKLMFRLKQDTLNELNKKKKNESPIQGERAPSWQKRIFNSCQKARINKGVVIAKSKGNLRVDFIFNTAVSRDSQWFVVAGKDMPIYKYNYYGHQVLKKSYKRKMNSKIRLQEYCVKN